MRPLKISILIVLTGFMLGVAIAAAPKSGEAGDQVDCADLGNLVVGTLNADLVVSSYPSVCVISGTVNGEVTVANHGESCLVQPPFVALLVRGTVNGNIRSSGLQCVMVWLSDGASVNGNVIHHSLGNVGFVGSDAGATVIGNVIVQSGHLWAQMPSMTNRIEGNIICAGGTPFAGAGTGTSTDWDGDGDTDGSVSGHYLC